MSESVLRALMQLFALISDIGNINEISSRERNVVRSFLARHLNREMIEKYLKIFDEYLDLYINREAITKNSEEHDIASLKTMRIKRICEGISRELRQKQRIYIVIQLIDYISYGKDITKNELDFLLTVAIALSIQENEYNSIKSFILDPISKVHEKEKLLLINSNPACKFKKIKHIFNQNLPGELLFLHILSTKTFLLRYSGNGAFLLNGQHIYPKQTYLFDNGSTIKGPGMSTLYYSEVSGFFSEPKSHTRITLTARDLTYRFTDSEKGVQNFNFQGESGNLIGILGVSGTGKSTLMNLLNGTLAPQGGSVFINGYNINNPKDHERLKGIIGYIPQDDLLIEELTVYQNIYYSARLCLSNIPLTRVAKIVSRIMIELDLWEIKDLKVGNPLDKVISGGQRKRVNIALELVREPFILFVDEPTSGLSSVDSEVVLNLLKEQTYKGKLVLVNIHQPGSDLFKLFDKIIILDKGGFQIFYGNPNEAIVYFKTHSRQANAEEDQCTKCGNINTEQVLQIVEAKIIDEHGKLTTTRKVTPEEWSDLFRRNFGEAEKKTPEEKIPLPQNLYSIPGLLKQSRIFFIRDVLSKFANLQYLLIAFLGAPLLALLLGYFTRYAGGSMYRFSQNENLPAYLFMCVITSLFLGLIISSEEILRDRKILRRESFLNLSWFSYINSKIGIMFIISAIQTMAFILVGNYVLEIKGMTWQYWLVLFTTSCCANMIGLNISSGFNSVITIYILIPFILIPQLLFSGVLVKYERLHRGIHTTCEYVPLIGELMPARWSFEALAVEQFKNNRYEKNFFLTDMGKSQDDWYANYLIPILNRYSQECLHFKDDARYKREVADNFSKLDLYTGRLTELAGFSFPEDLKMKLSAAKFDETAESRISLLLGNLKKWFMDRMKDFRSSGDRIEKTLEEKMGKSSVIKLRENYENRQLKDVVLDRTTIDKSVETDKKIIQKYEPGFMKPLATNGRAHFYAPVKNIGDTEVDTFVFDLLVLWTVSLVLYIMLYFRLFRKLIAFFENLRSRRSELDRISFKIEMPS